MDESGEKRPRELRGLYKYVNISVRTLDIIIVACLAVIVIFLAIELQNPGFTVSFDSKGGTDVPAHNQMYGQLLEVPEPPTREGYTFTGWYADHACTIPWDIEETAITGDLTLYAGWQAD